MYGISGTCNHNQALPSGSCSDQGLTATSENARLSPLTIVMPMLKPSTLKLTFPEWMSSSPSSFGSLMSRLKTAVLTLSLHDEMFTFDFRMLSKNYPSQLLSSHVWSHMYSTSLTARHWGLPLGVHRNLRTLSLQATHEREFPEPIIQQLLLSFVPLKCLFPAISFRGSYNSRYNKRSLLCSMSKI